MARCRRSNCKKTFIGIWSSACLFLFEVLTPPGGVPPDAGTFQRNRLNCHALSSWEPLPLGRPSAESWERPQRASQPWLEGNLSWAGACAEERADSLLFLSALVVWQQDFDICSGLSLLCQFFGAAEPSAFLFRSFF